MRAYTQPQRGIPGLLWLMGFTLLWGLGVVV